MNYGKNLTMSPTGLVLLIVAIILGLYDLGCVVLTGGPSSISQFLISTVQVSPLLYFSFGVVVGHLFCNMIPEPTACSCQEQTLGVVHRANGLPCYVADDVCHEYTDKGVK